LYRLGQGRAAAGIIDPGQIILHPDQSRCRVGRATPAGITGDAAEAQGQVAGQGRLALDEQMLVQGRQLEEVPRAGLDTIAAGSALGRIHHRQAVIVHGDGGEGAGDPAIPQAQAAPGTALAAAGDHGRRAATREALVFGDLIGLTLAAGAVEPGHSPLLLPRVHVQELGDGIDRLRARHRTAARRLLTRHQTHGKGPTARLAAGAAIRAGQPVQGGLDPRVLLNLQKTVGHRQDDGKENTQSGHNGRCN